jgi:hypothetical protein
VYIIDFEYANHRLSEFGCVVCHIDTSVGLREIDIGCDITFNTVKNNHSSVHSVTSSSYENVYTTTFDIAKNICSINGDDIYFTPYETREVMKWLNRRGHHKFKPFDLDNQLEDIHYFGSCNVKPLPFGAETIGLRVTFTSNAPYAFAESVSTRSMLLQSGSTFTLYGDSDECEATIYPKTTIRCFADGELNIKNLRTENIVSIKECINGETIILDGEYKIPLTDNEKHEKTLCSDFNYCYLDIEVDEYDTENTYEVSLPCEIIVSYSPIRKVGVY